MNEAKSIFKSKTLWFNVASLSLLVIQWATGRQLLAPDTQIVATGAVNLLLRYVTTTAVKVP